MNSLTVFRFKFSITFTMCNIL